MMKITVNINQMFIEIANKKNISLINNHASGIITISNTMQIRMLSNVFITSSFNSYANIITFFENTKLS